mgnify:FL=1
MKQDKVIVVCGFARGGTNILWNIIQSHPEIVAPLYETGQIFRRDKLLRILSWNHQIWDSSWTSKLIYNKIHNYKMESLRHPFNSYVNEHQKYKKESMAASIPCLKSVNKDIFLTDLLSSSYSNFYFIFLMRDVYALCESYRRRGANIPKFFRMYSRVLKKLQSIPVDIPNYCCVDFEDILHDPFRVSEKLFEFLEVSPSRLPKIRLKSKRVVSTGGHHSVIYGSEGEKYWFSPTTIRDAIDSRVDSLQSNRLDSMTKNYIEDRIKDELIFLEGHKKRYNLL